MRAEGKRKRKVCRGEMGRKREGERGERFWGFLFKFFSNSFSNFQTLLK
jgi:hypothetical protein